MAKAKIEQYYEAPGLTTDRFGKADVTIRYSIDGKGPYEVKHCVYGTGSVLSSYMLPSNKGERQ